MMDAGAAYGDFDSTRLGSFWSCTMPSRTLFFSLLHRVRDMAWHNCACGCPVELPVLNPVFQSAACRKHRLPETQKRKEKCSGPHDPRLRHHLNDDSRSTSDSLFLESAHRQFQFDNLHTRLRTWTPGTPHYVVYTRPRHPASGNMMAFFLIDKKGWHCPRIPTLAWKRQASQKPS